MSSRTKFKMNPSKRRSSRSAVEASADWLRLPNELWCNVFSYLPLIDLFSAEQVCQRWNDLVDLQLSSRRQFTVIYSKCNVNNINLKSVRRVLRRYGRNLKELTIIDAQKFGFNCAYMKMIGDWCPNLVKLVMEGETRVSDTALTKVAEKCVQLQSLSLLGSPSFSDEGLEYALKKLKQLKQLKIDFHHCLLVRDECLFHLTPNIEDLTLRNVPCLDSLWWDLNLPEKYTNLHKLDISTKKDPNRIFVDYLSEECVNIKELSLECRIGSNLLNEIREMQWLEKLHIKSSSRIDDRRLKLIARGCPNLRAFSLIGRSFDITDKGVKYLTKHCPQLVELDLSRNQKLTDMALSHLAVSGRVSCLAIRGCELITDRGCIYFIARCPQLLSMDIRHCPQLTTAIVKRCTRAVRHRTDRKPLTLMVKGTSINFSDVKIDCTRLIVDFRETSIVDFHHKSWWYTVRNYIRNRLF